MPNYQSLKIGLDWSRLLGFDQANEYAEVDPEVAGRLYHPCLAKLGTTAGPTPSA